METQWHEKKLKIAKKQKSQLGCANLHQVSKLGI